MAKRQAISVSLGHFIYMQGDPSVTSTTLLKAACVEYAMKVLSKPDGELCQVFDGDGYSETTAFYIKSDIKRVLLLQCK